MNVTEEQAYTASELYCKNFKDLLELHKEVNMVIVPVELRQLALELTKLEVSANTIQNW